MKFKGFNDWVEVFRAGEHTDSAGNKRTWTEGDLDKIVAGYDPAKHEAPAVIGHPKDNDPAYGWVTGLKREGDMLLAKFGDVAEGFEEAVKQGRFKKRSIALYPDLTLRHVGFLGAVPPAIKGLKDLAFEDAQEPCVIEFSEIYYRWGFDSLARGLRNLKNLLIEDKGLEKANEILPEYVLEDVQRAAEPDPEPADSSAYSELNGASGPRKTKEDTMQQYSEADLAAAQKNAADEREASVRAEFARDARKGQIEAFCEGLKKEGKLTPAQMKLGLNEFMNSLDAETTIEFAEGQPKTSALDFMKAFLNSLPKQVEFREVASSGKTLPDDAEAARDQAISTYMEAHQGTSYKDAVLAVSSENPELFVGGN